MVTSSTIKVSLLPWKLGRIQITTSEPKPEILEALKNYLTSEEVDLTNITSKGFVFHSRYRFISLWINPYSGLSSSTVQTSDLGTSIEIQLRYLKEVLINIFLNVVVLSIPIIVFVSSRTSGVLPSLLGLGMVTSAVVLLNLIFRNVIVIGYSHQLGV